MSFDPNTHRDLEHRFAYHKPPNDETGERHGTVRRECLTLAETILELVPESRERSLAFTKLEEVMMWANAGIARNPT